MNAIEEWKPTLRHEGYEASNLGRVRSLDRIVVASNGRAIKLKGRILKASSSGNYFTVHLGSGDTSCVHHVICEAFHGQRPKGYTAAHWNGDTTNNRADNLRWATYSENIADKIRHGTSQHGERNAMAKLSQESVIELRFMYESGEPLEALEVSFGVSGATILDACLGRTWKHVEGAKKPRPKQSVNGERHWDARLTAEIVREMRALYANGATNLAALGRRFGITQRAAMKICRRMSWKHV